MTFTYTLALLTDRTTSRKLIRRYTAVLLTADGYGIKEVVRLDRTFKPTLWHWQECYIVEGVDGLRADKTRPSRVPPLPRETRLRVIAKTVRKTLSNATYWSCAEMAEVIVNSTTTVGCIWSEAGLKPHLTRGFKVSSDPTFEEKASRLSGFTVIHRSVLSCFESTQSIHFTRLIEPI